MANEKKAEAQPKADKPKATRKVLTQAERIAKAEAELQALRDKAAAADQAKATKVREALAKAESRAKEAQAKVDELKKELETLTATAATSDTEEPGLKVV